MARYYCHSCERRYEHERDVMENCVECGSEFVECVSESEAEPSQTGTETQTDRDGYSFTFYFDNPEHSHRINRASNIRIIPLFGAGLRNGESGRRPRGLPSLMGQLVDLMENVLPGIMSRTLMESGRSSRRRPREGEGSDGEDRPRRTRRTESETDERTIDENDRERMVRVLFADQPSSRSLPLLSRLGMRPILGMFSIPGNLGDYAFDQNMLDNIVSHLLDQDLPQNYLPGASDEQIEELSRISVDEDLSAREIECVICKENLVLGNVAIRLDCQHIFHENCLVSWLRISGTCPICRCSIADKHGDSEEQSTESQEQQDIQQRDD